MPFPSVPIHLPSDIDVKLHINHGVVGLSVNFVVDITNFFLCTALLLSAISTSKIIHWPLYFLPTNRDKSM